MLRVQKNAQQLKNSGGSKVTQPLRGVIKKGCRLGHRTLKQVLGSFALSDLSSLYFRLFTCWKILVKDIKTFREKNFTWLQMTQERITQSHCKRWWCRRQQPVKSEQRIEKEKHMFLQWRDSPQSKQTLSNNLQERSWNTTEGTVKVFMWNPLWKRSVPTFGKLFKKVKYKIGSAVKGE